MSNYVCPSCVTNEVTDYNNLSSTVTKILQAHILSRAAH